MLILLWNYAESAQRMKLSCIQNAKMYGVFCIRRSEFEKKCESTGEAGVPGVGALPGGQLVSGQWRLLPYAPRQEWIW